MERMRMACEVSGGGGGAGTRGFVGRFVGVVEVMTVTVVVLGRLRARCRRISRRVLVRSGCVADNGEGGDVRRTRVLKASRNCRAERFCGNACFFFSLINGEVPKERKTVGSTRI